MGITHAFVSEVEDGADETLVRPSNWNATHAGLIAVSKPDDQIVNNSTTLVNDEDLLFAVGANDIWVIYVILYSISATTTPKIDYAFAVPSGGAVRTIKTWLTSGTLEIFGDGTAESTLTVSTTVKVAQFMATYIGGGTAGNLQLQWAQNVATAENTTLKTDSSLVAFKVG